MHNSLYDYYLKTLAPEKIKAFELHLFHCSKCQQEIARLDQAFASMQQQPEAFRHQLKLKTVTEKKRGRYRGKSMMRFALAAVLVLVLSWVGLSHVARPRYFHLARLSGELQIEAVRGERTVSDFYTGLEKFRRRDYSAAIAAWQKQLQSKPDDYQANYLTGLAYLADGERSFLGFKYFSDERSRQAIAYLEKSLRLAGANAFYQEEGLWLSGKAWLRLKNVERANQAWQAIVDLPGTDLIHKKDAEQYLLQLENDGK